MEALAKYRKLAISPRKVRLVVDIVRGMNVQEALGILKQIPNKAAPFIIKLIKSAVANLEFKAQGKKFLRGTVNIKEIFVDGGCVLKRTQPAPKGRAHPIRKPSCHVTAKVAVDETNVIKEKSIVVDSASKVSIKVEKVDKEASKIEIKKAVVSPEMKTSPKLVTDKKVAKIEVEAVEKTAPPKEKVKKETDVPEIVTVSKREKPLKN